MAFFEIPNVRIAGVSAGVPKQVIQNVGDAIQSRDYDAAAFVETTGVIERRCSKTFTTSDLGYAAAEKLIADLGWDKSEIEVLIFVSQTADYILPATSCVLQERLGLSKECYASDVSLGCSGWVYGLSEAASLISVANGCIKKGLLVAGDARGIIDAPWDPLFGHAATVTALEFDTNADSLKFHFGTDGSGYDAIITLDGGCRNQLIPASFDMECIDGKPMNRLMTRMKGMDVFSFGISVPPKSIKKLAERYSFDYLEYDYFVFHQANMKMNGMIAKKLKLPLEKVPSCMAHFGNTSSASIPLTIVTELKGKVKSKKTKFLCCGFGVGLSWGTVAFECDDKMLISDLIEI